MWRYNILSNGTPQWPCDHVVVVTKSECLCSFKFLTNISYKCLRRLIFFSETETVSVVGYIYSSHLPKCSRVDIYSEVSFSAFDPSSILIVNHMTSQCILDIDNKWSSYTLRYRKLEMKLIRTSSNLYSSSWMGHKAATSPPHLTLSFATCWACPKV